MASGLTLSMIVKNEEKRYLRKVLEELRNYIDQAVIIDDGSKDQTVQLCKEALANVPLVLIENQQSKFTNEVDLRKQQWEATIQTAPAWILNLDADELFEKDFPSKLPAFLQSCQEDVVYFRLFDMWGENHYREDHYWRAHHMYRPFIVRYKENVTYHWRETKQHCGRFPTTISQFSYYCHPARIKHYGWAAAADRLRKYRRYMELDPNGEYGWLEQYESILDENPQLKRWVD